MCIVVFLQKRSSELQQYESPWTVMLRDCLLFIFKIYNSFKTYYNHEACGDLFAEIEQDMQRNLAPLPYTKNFLNFYII